jgi:hypothetical protein
MIKRRRDVMIRLSVALQDTIYLFCKLFLSRRIMTGRQALLTAYGIGRRGARRPAD